MFRVSKVAAFFPPNSARGGVAVFDSHSGSRTGKFGPSIVLRQGRFAFIAKELRCGQSWNAS